SVSRAMSHGLPFLRSWDSSQQLNFGNNRLGQADMRAISLDDLISHFKSALSSHCKELIKAMWDGNLLLRAWYSGQQVNFGNNRQVGAATCTVCVYDLIVHSNSAW